LVDTVCLAVQLAYRLQFISLQAIILVPLLPLAYYALRHLLFIISMPSTRLDNIKTSDDSLLAYRGTQ